MGIMQALYRLLGFLTPRQRMRETGHGNMQAGTVGRDVTNVTIFQTVHVAAPISEPEDARAPGNVDRSCTEAQPVRAETVEKKPSPPVDQDVAVLRRELFALLEKFDKTPDRRVIVLNWMEQQFGTKRVVELDRQQLFRTVRWSMVVLENRRSKREGRGTALHGGEQ